MNTGRGHSIHNGGGLRTHLAMIGISWDTWLLVVEPNWKPPSEKRQGHYIGIKVMARILGVSDASVIKWLKVYDKEIGRTRTYDTETKE